MYSAYAIANAFIRRAQDGRLSGLNSMKLQKLMYFAQAWHLQKKRVPLFRDTFTRGLNGPVLNSIDHQVMAYGTRPIKQTIRILSGGEDPEAWRIPDIRWHDDSALGLVDAICSHYGAHSAEVLSEMTHRPGSAWSQGGADGSPITNESIYEDTAL